MSSATARGPLVADRGCAILAWRCPRTKWTLPSQWSMPTTAATCNGLFAELATPDWCCSRHSAGSRGAVATADAGRRKVRREHPRELEGSRRTLRLSRSWRPGACLEGEDAERQRRTGRSAIRGHLRIPRRQDRATRQISRSCRNCGQPTLRVNVSRLPKLEDPCQPWAWQGGAPRSLGSACLFRNRRDCCSVRPGGAGADDLITTAQRRQTSCMPSSASALVLSARRPNVRDTARIQARGSRKPRSRGNAATAPGWNNPRAGRSEECLIGSRSEPRNLEAPPVRTSLQRAGRAGRAAGSVRRCP